MFEQYRYSKSTLDPQNDPHPRGKGHGFITFIPKHWIQKLTNFFGPLPSQGHLMHSQRCWCCYRIIPLWRDVVLCVLPCIWKRCQKKGAWPRPIMMVKKRKNGTKAAQWISEEPWRRSFLGSVWLEQKIDDSLHMGYHTHPNSIQFSKSQRYATWDPRLAAPYPNRKGIVLEPLQKFDNLELMLHHRPKTLHDKGLNTWQSNCSASMVIWGIGESKGCFQVATEGGVSQAEASQSIASQKFGSHVVTMIKRPCRTRGCEVFFVSICSCLAKTNMIPTIAASKRLFRFCTSKILSFLRKEGTKKRCGSCGGGSWERTAERSQSTLPKFQGSVDERASHGFPTIQVKLHILLLPFSNRKLSHAPLHPMPARCWCSLRTLQPLCWVQPRRPGDLQVSNRRLTAFPPTSPESLPW